MSESIDNKIPVLVEDLGMRFATDKSKRKSRYGLYQCQYCGKEFEGLTSSIKNGNTKSCGCLKNISHQLSKHPLYSIWNGMKGRCNNPKYKKYKDYGGRGIQVCERWMDVGNFIEDMYPSYKKGLSIDRIDVNGNYEPDNCRWTTVLIQNRNTRELYIHNTSGYRGVVWDKKCKKWRARISINNKTKHIGVYTHILEAAKAYERYIRLNNLEHNFTPVLTEGEIEEINKQKERI